MARIDPRVVEVVVDFATAPGSSPDPGGHPGKNWSQGSGYLVTPSVVLTARHLLDPPGPGLDVAQVRVREADQSDSTLWATARDWWPRRDAGIPGDIALVIMSEPFEEKTATVAVRWGWLGGRGRVPCRAAGLPDATTGTSARVEHVEGHLEPVSGAIHVLGASPLPAPRGSHWQGLSGAAVFVGPWLVAVVTEQPANFGSDRLAAELVEDIVGQPGFAELVGAPLRIEQADMPAWLLPPYERPWTSLRESAQILRPKHGIVPFRPRPELDGLVDWCTSAEPYALRLLTGEGGQGKTRLAAELCAILARRGWLAGFVDRTTPLSAGGTTSIGPSVLLVVDYAETQGDRLPAVIAACGRFRAPVRVLLLARHAHDWWTDLKRGSDRPELVAGVQPEPLPPLLSEPATRTAEFERATTALAAYLGVPSPTEAPDDLQRDSAYENALLVHLAALTQLTAPATTALPAATLLDSTLEREDHRHWLPIAERQGIQELLDHARLRRRVVAVATLTEPADDRRADALLATLPELDGDDSWTHDLRRRIVAWLRQTYPPVPTEERRGFGALEPDRLGEHLVAAVVSAPEDPELLPRLTRVTTDQELTRLVFVLTAAARHSRDAEEALRALILSPRFRARPAPQTGRPRPVSLDQALSDAQRIAAPPPRPRRWWVAGAAFLAAVVLSVAVTARVLGDDGEPSAGLFNPPSSAPSGTSPPPPPATTTTTPSTCTSSPGDPMLSVDTSFAAPGISANGLAFDGEDLWVSDNSATIFRVALDGSTEGDYDAPASTPNGISWDGEALWVHTSSAGDIIRFAVGADGQVTTLGGFPSQFQPGLLSYLDMTWVDGELLLADSFSVRRLSPTGDEFDSTPYPQEVGGLEWDGARLWVAFTDPPSCVRGQIGGDDGQETRSYQLPIQEVVALTWADDTMWVLGADEFGGERRIYRLDPP